MRGTQVMAELRVGLLGISVLFQMWQLCGQLPPSTMQKGGPSAAFERWDAAAVLRHPEKFGDMAVGMGRALEEALPTRAARWRCRRVPPPLAQLAMTHTLFMQHRVQNRPHLRKQFTFEGSKA